MLVHGPTDKQRIVVSLNDESIGFVSIATIDTLAEVRKKICEQVDGAPDYFVFKHNNNRVPVSDEQHIPVQMMMPKLVICKAFDDDGSKDDGDAKEDQDESEISRGQNRAQYEETMGSASVHSMDGNISVHNSVR